MTHVNTARPQAEFDRDLALTAIDSEVRGEPVSGEVDVHRFAAVLPGGWSVGGGINGGFLLALLGNAVRQSVPERPDPVTLAATYLGASVAGPAEITTRVLRRGTLTSVAVELAQEGTARISAIATFSDLSTLSDEVATTAQPPTLAPVEQCLASSQAPDQFIRIAPIVERFEMRFDPACVGWILGEPTGAGEFRAWFRLHDREPDPLSLLMTADAMPPVTFDLGRPGWAPTVQLTVHVRAVPAPGWLRMVQRTTNVAGGFFEEDCEIWDSADRLVAQARQLARVPR